MDALHIPNGGLKLAQNPKPADPYKRDRVSQAVAISLSGDGMQQVLSSVLSGGEAVASLGARSTIELSSKSAGGSTDKREIPAKLVEKSLSLSENGFLYKTNDGAGLSTLRARLDMRMPQKRSHGEVDAGLLALTRGIDDAKAQKQSHRTTLADPAAAARRRRSKPSLVASIAGSNDLKAHRAGLFDRGKQLSSLSSPSLHAMSPLGHSEKDDRKARAEEAKKRALIHLLAVRPISKADISKTLRAPAHSVEGLVDKYAQPSRTSSSKFELKDNCYRLLDPYGFGYPAEDRALAIDRAIEAFDRKRLAKTDKLWQMLLPKDERGKGRCLSKLVSRLLPTDASSQQHGKTLEARATPIPEISVSEAGSPRPGSVADEAEVSRKRSSSDSVNGDASDRATKRVKQDTTSVGKRLFLTPQQREREKAKEMAREAKQRAQEMKGGHPATKRPDSRSNNANASPKIGARKAAEARLASIPASAAGRQPDKVKSAEFVTESDDEKADAEVKEAQATQTAKPTASATQKTVSKTTAKPTSTAKLASSKASDKSTEKLVAPGGKKLGAAAASATSAPDNSAKQSSAWDFSQNKKPAASTLNRPSPKVTAASRPVATPSNVNLHHRKQLKESSRAAAAASASARDKAPSPSQRSAANAKSASVSKPGEKVVTPRSELVRKLDSAKRPSSSEARPAGKSSAATAATTRPSNSGAPGPDRYTITGRRDRPRSTGGPASGPGATSASARASDTIKAQPMQKTFSHQRKSSSPLKPSPLAASPPINLSDIDDAARNNRGPPPAKPLSKKPTASVANATAKDAARPLKRKADDTDSQSAKKGVAQAGTQASSFERPAKRRDTVAANPVSNGAASSKPAAARHSDTSIATRRYSQDDSGNNNSAGNKSHSPSPASSTIGSTSTKSTSLSLLSAGAAKDERMGNDRGSMAKADTGNTSNKADAAAIRTTGKALGKEAEGVYKGIKHSELERMAQFEDQREEYNRKLKEATAMENPPLAKVRELNHMFHSLETQKKVFAALERNS